MNRLKYILMMLAFCASVFAAEDLIAEWDFTKHDALKGKYPLVLRGTARLEQCGLVVPAAAKDARSGAVTAKKFKDLSPDGSFALKVEFSLTPGEKIIFPYQMLLDCKYVPAAKNNAYHKGFMLYLRRVKNEYIPCAALGYGNKSIFIAGSRIRISSGKIHTLELQCDIKGRAEFLFDHVSAGTAVIPAQKIEPAAFPLCFGDRVGSNFWNLGGVIRKVSICRLQTFDREKVQPGTVLASWDFSSPQVLKNEPKLVLRGKTKLVKTGLMINNMDITAASGAVVSGKTAQLTPANAFEISAVLTLPRGSKRPANRAMIYDSKYIVNPSPAQLRFHKGFMFYLICGGNPDVFRPAAAFGFGNDSVNVSGRNIKLLPGREYRLTMRFSAVGSVEFLIDGKSAGSAVVPVGCVAVPEKFPVIGDRIGANYQPLGGVIRKLEIRTIAFSPRKFVADATQRLVFERGEKNAKLYVNFHNFIAPSFDQVTVKAEVAGKSMPDVKIAALVPGKSVALTYPVDTFALPGEYEIKLSAFDAAGKMIAADTIGYTIVPVPGDRLPVVLWGAFHDLKSVKKYGFTHQVKHIFPRSGTYTEALRKEHVPLLDRHMKEGLYTIAPIHTNYRFLRKKEFLRVDRSGNIYKRNTVEASNPAVQKEMVDVTSETMKQIADHPAVDGVLLNSEVRDRSQPSFRGSEQAAFKKFSGFDIPATIVTKKPGILPGSPLFPWDGVIPADCRELIYLRWFIKEGDGWNPLHSLIADAIRKNIRQYDHKQRFFIFYDPVVRIAPLWGSGGNVDMVNQWSYVYPDPIKIGQATDETIAMAQGRPGQKISAMTQAIWYRSQTAPMHQKVKNPPAWMETEADAKMISIAPDALREAFWSKISRRLDAIMYHGADSLLGQSGYQSYRFTNPESREVLRELSQQVIEPLGPVLKRVPERPLRVAILESFAASLYSSVHFPFGWSRGWIADLHLALQWGHIPAGIVFDEHLFLERYTRDLKVLFVPGLEAVQEKTLAQLNRLRARGVILVGDQFTTPALMLDLRVKSIARKNSDPAGTKKQLQQLGRELQLKLKKYLPQEMSASNQDIVLRSRGSDKADYVFVVNDKRTFGNYVGQWKLVQEKGLKNPGSVTVNHPAAAAYDLVAHKMIPLRRKDGSSVFDVELVPGGGKLILLLDRKIDHLQLSVPPHVARGKAFRISCSVMSADQKEIPAILPIELTIVSSDGRKLPGSGYYAACNGKFQLQEIMATNAALGKCRVTFRCLASGKVQTAGFEVGD